MKGIFKLGQVYLVVAMVGFGTVFTPVAAASASNSNSSNLANQVVGSCPQAPRNVDLTRLSDEQLLAYGLPEHSSVDQDLAFWTNMARTMTRICTKPSPGHHKTRLLDPAARLGGASCSGQPGTICHNYVWAGNEANGSSGTYRSASVTFNVPNVSLAPVGEYASSWVGIGGDTFVAGSGAVIVQAGIDVENVCCFGNQHNTSWIDVEPNMGNAKDLPLCRLNTGDSIHVYIESNLNNEGYDYFNITNNTANCYHSCIIHTTYTGVSDTCGVTGGASFNSDGRTGECIVERLNAGLAEWNAPGHHLTQSQCDINNTAIGLLSHHYNVIINTSNQTLADVSSLTNNDTQSINWHQDQ